MNSSLKFSIITVSLNNQSTIRRTINSVLNQKYVDVEYIVIDGLSTDDTMKIVESYKENISYYKNNTNEFESNLKVLNTYQCFLAIDGS